MLCKGSAWLAAVGHRKIIKLTKYDSKYLMESSSQTHSLFCPVKYYLLGLLDRLMTSVEPKHRNYILFLVCS